MRILRVAVGCVLALLAGSVLVSVPAASLPAGPPVRIGISLGLTGAYAEIGDMQAKAYRLWERHVNARGGMLGRRVELVIRDDKSDAEAAKTIYRDFIEKDKIEFVFAPYSSEITSAVAPIAEQNGYPMLAAGAASDDLWKRGYRHLFGMIPTAGRYTVGFLALLAEARIKRLAVVYVDDVYGMSVIEGTTKWAAEYEIQIVYSHKIAKGSNGLDGIVQAAEKSGAEALLVAGHFDEAVNMRKAIKRVWMPRAYFASVGPALDAYQEAVGSDVDGTFSASIWEAREDLQLPGSAEFLREFIRVYGETPAYQAAQAYAAGQVLALAIAKAGRIDRSQVRDALAELDTNVLIGRYVVDRRGLQVKRSPMVIQWQGGKREIVWPEELKTAAPIFNR